MPIFKWEEGRQGGYEKLIISIAASRLIRNAFVGKCVYRSIAYTTGKEIQKADRLHLLRGF